MNRGPAHFLGLRLGFRAQINFILSLGLALLAAVGVFSYRSIDELVSTGRDEGAALADLGRLERVLTETAGQTELVEMIDYEPPGGLLGLAMTPAVVERELAQAYFERVLRVLGRMTNEGTPCASSTSPRR